MENLLTFVAEKKYKSLYKKHEIFLHLNELAYFQSFTSEIRKKNFLLGRYAGKRALSPLLREKNLRKIEIAFGGSGEPIVRHPSRKKLGVSISHCDGLAAAVAFSAKRPMGIDVEKIQKRRIQAIRRQLMPREIKLLPAGPTKELVFGTMFWSVKEALSKALRTGIIGYKERYEIKKADFDGRCMTGSFRNFPQYRFWSWLIEKDTAAAVVFPKHLIFLDCLKNHE